MKKYLPLLLILLVLNACKKDFDETVFAESTDKRITKTLDSLQARLVTAAAGWNAFLTTGTGRTTGFYFQFHGANRVVMVNPDVTNGTVPKESSYRLKALQQPVLMFDTYSYLHTFADPDGSVNGGKNGVGLRSDFEFAYDPSASNTDSIVLRGRMHDSKMVLRPASTEDAAAFANNEFPGLVFDSLSKKYLNYFKRFELGNTTYELVVNPRTKQLKMAWMEGGTYREKTTAYSYMPAGVVFFTPFMANGVSFKSFSNPVWDNATTTISFSINGQTVRPVGFTAPLQVDISAPRRWWEKSRDEDDYWFSRTGFRVNGVDDAYRVASLPLYRHLMYQAENGVYNGTMYDAFGYVYGIANVLTRRFAPGVISPPNFMPDGRITFSLAAGADEGLYFGNDPGTASVNTFIPVLRKMIDAQGYIFVQINDTYDMVDAVNATSWINWEF
ncbi:DUF4302 domain-containing protein [Terrimonas rubra]|uniref:DUF4302 domain-containing protein n=1 Tax=Terrimonas rubra TaxID=1035890 RepID=A0ABW6A978_9BACT